MPDLTITAHMGAPVMGLAGQAFLLDGPLAWAMWQEEGAPVITDGPRDFDLPLARWEEAGTWGFCASRAHYTAERHTATQIRRRPATQAMARYTTDREHHSGLGPTKARDVIVPLTWARTIAWDADVTDRDRLEHLLSLLTHLGGGRSSGHGQVRSWDTTDGPPEGWRDRPMPSTHPGEAMRPPYWHPGRRAA